MQRIYRVPPLLQDVLLAAAATLADLYVFSPGHPAGRGAYALGGCLVLMWRRRVPFTVFVGMCMAFMGGIAVLDYNPYASLLLGVYTVAARSSPKKARMALVIVILVIGVDTVHQSFFGMHRGLLAFLATVVFDGLLLGLAWGAGRWIHERRRRVKATQALAAERARIARELHDIVAHSVTVMMLQAAVANRVMGANPDRAAESLTDIDNQGRQAMDELRRMLVVLRADNDGDDTEPPAERQRGLADVHALVEGVSRVGVSVRLEATGDPPRLDPSVDLAAYRVVQEALTNTTRHAGPGAHAIVRWTWSGEGDLVVQVRDAGDGKPDRTARGFSTGHGLLGLRERVTVVGGHLDAGPTLEGGFQVTATLPVAERGGPMPPRGESGAVAPPTVKAADAV